MRVQHNIYNDSRTTVLPLPPDAGKNDEYARKPINLTAQQQQRYAASARDTRDYHQQLTATYEGQKYQKNKNRLSLYFAQNLQNYRLN